MRYQAARARDAASSESCWADWEKNDLTSDAAGNAKSGYTRRGERELEP